LLPHNHAPRSVKVLSDLLALTGPTEYVPCAFPNFIPVRWVREAMKDTLGHIAGVIVRRAMDGHGFRVIAAEIDRIGAQS
jgi:hypothetical protein